MARKGFTNNPSGRPKGKPNKSTILMKEWIIKLINDNTTQLECDLKKVSSVERWKIISGLIQFVIPRVNQQTVNADINLNNLSEEDINRIINEIEFKIYEDE